MSQSHNVGGIERAVRILIALALFGVAWFHVLTGGLAIVAYVVGGIALITSLAGYCPAWTVFGINTGAGKHAKAASSGH